MRNCFGRPQARVLGVNRSLPHRVPSARSLPLNPPTRFDLPTRELRVIASTSCVRPALLCHVCLCTESVCVRSQLGATAPVCKERIECCVVDKTVFGNWASESATEIFLSSAPHLFVVAPSTRAPENPRVSCSARGGGCFVSTCATVVDEFSRVRLHFAFITTSDGQIGVSRTRALHPDRPRRYRLRTKPASPLLSRQ